MCTVIKDTELPEEGEISASPCRSPLELSPWDSASSGYELLARSPVDDQIESFASPARNRAPTEPASVFDSVETQYPPRTLAELLQQSATQTPSEFESRAPSFGEQSNTAVEAIDSRRFSAEELGTLPETELVVRERGIEVEILRLRDLLLAIKQERQRRLIETLREEYPAGSRLTRTKEPLQFCGNRIWAEELALMVDARRQSEMLADQVAVSGRRPSATSLSAPNVRMIEEPSGSNGVPDSGSPNNEPLDKARQIGGVADAIPKDFPEYDEKPPPPPPGRPRTLYTMDAINGLVYEVIEVDLTGGIALTPSGLQDLSDAHYVFGRDQDTDALVLLENITHLFKKFPYLNGKREV